MWNGTIGESAGKVWQALCDKGERTLTQLKKDTGLEDKDLYLALGWLSREGKLGFAQKGKTGVSVRLV